MEIPLLNPPTSSALRAPSPEEKGSGLISFLGRTSEGAFLIVLLYPGGCIGAEFLRVGFIEGSEEFEDGIG